MFHIKQLKGKPDTFGLLVHRLQSYDKIKKYDEASHVESAEKPYFIEVGATSRTINVYIVASMDIKYSILV